MIRTGIILLLFWASVALATDTVPSPRDLTDWHLGRAVDLWVSGDLHGAAAHLEEMDVGRNATTPSSDRAAFLLAVAYLRLGDREGLSGVVDIAADPNGSSWRRWVAYLGLLESSGDPVAVDGFAGADLLAAARHLESGRPDLAYDLLAGEDDVATLQLRTLAAEAMGRDADRDRKRLAERKPESKPEADLIGAAILALADDDLAAGHDPRARLKKMPPESAFAARAVHLSALSSLAKGDTLAATGLLQDLVSGYPDYTDRRMALLESGSLAGAEGDWPGALARYETAEADLAEEHLELKALQNSSDEAWKIWEDQHNWRQEIRLDTGAARHTLDEAVLTALDLGNDDRPARPDALSALSPSTPLGRVLQDQPTAEEWLQVRSLQTEMAAAGVAVADQKWQIQDLSVERSRRQDYLDVGTLRATTAADTLAAAVARLDILLGRLDTALNNLDSARDRALARFGNRCLTMATELRRNLLYLEAVGHFHLGGPAKTPAPPAGIPSLNELLGFEASLALEMESFLTTFDARSEDLINRSHALVWRPRLEEQTPALRTALAAELSRAQLAAVGIDLEKERLANDPAWRDAVAHLDILVSRSDSLATTHRDLKRTVAINVANRGLARLDAEREAIALHAADAAFWLAASADGDETETARTTRTAALERHQSFLADHPQAGTRSEIRFRLADLHLMQARDDFREHMASFLGENPSADALHDRGLAPFVNTAPAVALFGAILADDPSYAHRDAVLFSLGMILADDGQSEGEARLTELVAGHADSPYAQEAWLRLGDVGFDRKDLAACRQAYGRAAEGTDPDLKAIALYKLGWARFEDDMFAAAADAFGELMDSGVPDDSERAPQDLTDEAKEYLVRSLVRAGGAKAFASHFDRNSDRPYAADILHDMGAVDRRFSLYAEAVACDKLWLERYGTDPRALEVAERLVDSHHGMERPDEALAALLTQAPRFLDGSPWHQANKGAELRVAGRTFAQEAYRTAATRSHHTARESGDTEHWRTALGHYETWLGHWGSDASAPRLHYQAGEAATRLARYEEAITHFSRAAVADTGDFVLDAAWQTVAVTDAWFEEAGADSLAERLLTSGEKFLEDYPTDSRAADLRWRAGNMAYGNGWHERAAVIFTDFETSHSRDPRAADAARLVADAWYQHPDLKKAGNAYEHALGLARTAGRDSLATVLAATVPLVRFQHAETVAADSTLNSAEASALFLTVADRWPAFDHADLALYRTGLGLADTDGLAAVAAWERLLDGYPDSEYDRDASVEIARLHEKDGRRIEAAAAYENFSRRHPDDPDASEALLMAIDLSEKDPATTRRRQEEFVTRFAGQTEQVMAIRHGWALSALTGTSAASISDDLSSYLAAAAVHPEWADPMVLAEVDYRSAETAYQDYLKIGLTQPLTASLEIKKARLEEVIGLYNRCVQQGVREFSHASAHRIGSAIVHFGDALKASERPSDLSGDDLFTYEEVLEEQGWSFYSRGEEAWTQLLKQNRNSDDDPGAWIARTQEALWPRVAQRFMHQPEVEYPLVAAAAPAKALEITRSEP